MSNDQPTRSIALGEPLDQMLNAECKYSFQLDALEIPSNTGGLLRPTPFSPGTGNIVIRGLAGSGKSTLALQILCEAVRRNNHTYGAYISLEESQAHIFEKAINYRWSPYVWPLNTSFPVDTAATVDQLANDLKNILRQPMQCYALGVPTNPRPSSKDYNGWFETPTPENFSRCPYKGGDDRPCPFRRRCYTAKRDKPKLDPTDDSAENEFVDSPGIVILPKLLPRPFEPCGRSGEQEDLFWKRYKQLDDLLNAAKHLRLGGNSSTDLGLVCIDSLNVLGAGGLMRDHLSALFDLFKRRQMLGIFVVEENESGVFAGDSPIDSDTIDFLADMVINLTTTEEEGYWLRYFQITKSRHQKHVLGRHPFKISGTSGGVGYSTDGKAENSFLIALDRLRDTNIEAEQEKEFKPDNWRLGKELRRKLPMETGLQIFPSIHTIVAASDRLVKDPHTHIKNRRIWSSDNLQKLVRLESSHGPHIFTITGPATSGKSLIAGNFLLEGLRFGEDVLLIRLGEKPEFMADGSWSPKNASDVSSNCAPKGCWSSSMSQVDRNGKKLLRGTNTVGKPQCPNQIRILRTMLSVFEPQKIQHAIHEFNVKFLDPEIKKQDDYDERKGHRCPLLIEIAMKPGAMLPEEFVEVVRVVYKWGRHFRCRPGFDIRRVALLEVGAIGSQYPLLQRSSTASELLLSAFAHILRCRGTDFLMTAQTGGIPESENLVKKAISLADHVISCDQCDVFGDRYITVSGPGLVESDMISGKTPESVPGVLRRRKGQNQVHFFEIDFERLQGLVGFSSGHIRRPGVALQLFEEGTLHKRYNSQVGRLVEFAMGSARAVLGGDSSDSKRPLLNVPDSDAPAVVVDTFDSVNAAPFHGSLGLLRGAPLHNTVLRTVDEFAVKDALDKEDIDFEGDDFIRQQLYYRSLYAHLYYRNVLLIACDHETSRLLTSHKKLIPFWEEVARLVTKENVAFLCDQRAAETLACLAMDGIQSIWPEHNRADLCKREPMQSKKEKLKNYLDLMSKILPYSKPIINPNVPYCLSEASFELVEDRTHRVSRLTNVLKEELTRDAPVNLDSSSLVAEVNNLYSKSARISGASKSQCRYIILCWYSHLRELISLYRHDKAVDTSRARRMVKDMRILGLPNGGYTGDWYITVPSGSVSESLGTRIKASILDPREDLKRFIDGVGLPAWPKGDGDFFGFSDLRYALGSAFNSKGGLGKRKKTIKAINDFLKTVDPEKGSSRSLSDALEKLKRENPRKKTLPTVLKELSLLSKKEEQLAVGIGLLPAFERHRNLKQAAKASRHTLMAWPGGTVPLKDVLDIHRLANRRSELPGYQKVRSELFALMKHLQSRQMDTRGLPSKDIVKHMIALAKIAYCC